MSRNSDYFKKIQLSLFDFLNLNVSEKYKDKDLLGPLKYLDNPNIQDTKPTNQTESLALGNIPEIYTESVLDLPLIVERKPYLRHIRFYIKPNSTIHVVAPLNRPLDLIKKEITEHKEWVFKCNQKFQTLRDKFPMKKFLSGEKFPVLGETFFLKLEAVDLKKPLLQLDLDQLQYFYPSSWDLKTKPEKEQLLKKHLKKFYHGLAVSHLNQRLRILSERTKIFPKSLSFRNQKTRWGSCSSSGSLNLNWKLVAFDPDLIDYVIIHELCHIPHPNHSPRFWALVQSFCENYKQLNKRLNQMQFEADFLATESELYFSNPSFI